MLVQVAKPGAVEAVEVPYNVGDLVSFRSFDNSTILTGYVKGFSAPAYREIFLLIGAGNPALPANHPGSKSNLMPFQVPVSQVIERIKRA